MTLHVIETFHIEGRQKVTLQTSLKLGNDWQMVGEVEQIQCV